MSELLVNQTARLRCNVWTLQIAMYAHALVSPTLNFASNVLKDVLKMG